MFTTLARKNLMAVSGLFLCAFLLVHVLGNAALLLPEGQGREAFNHYAALLSSFLPIKLAEAVILLGIVLHVALGLVLTRQARTAAGTRYIARATPATSPWSSRFMAATGLLIFIFLVVHLGDFWLPYKFGVDAVGTDAAGQRDLYGLVASTLGGAAHAAFYCVAMLAVGLHLRHGVVSGLRSLGMYPPGLTRAARVVGTAFAIGVTLAFLAITVSLFVRRV